MRDQALAEPDAYPADPESGYGWEKLFNEILTNFYEADYDMNVRIPRYHNVYGRMALGKVVVKKHCCSVS